MEELDGIVQHFVTGTWTKAECRSVLREYVVNANEELQWGITDPDKPLAQWYELLDEHQARLDKAAARGQDRGRAFDIDVGGEPDGGDEPPPKPSGAVVAGKKRARDPRVEDDDSSDSDSDPDDDEELRGHKRSKGSKGNESDQETSEFGWAAEGILNNATWSPAHIKVMRKVTVYQKDLVKALRNLAESGANPPFPDHLWRTVLQDKYVNLDEVYADIRSRDSGRAFVTTSEAAAAIVSTFGEKPKTRKILDQIGWQTAYNSYVKAVVCAFPSRRDEMRLYEEHIRGIFERRHISIHPQILAYDMAVRKLVGATRRLLFSDFKDDAVRELYESYLDYTGEWFNRTSREDGEASSTRRGVAGLVTGSSSHRAEKRKREVCRRYNFNTCFGVCERLHVCSVCRGAHTASSGSCKGGSAQGGGSGSGKKN